MKNFSIIIIIASICFCTSCSKNKDETTTVSTFKTDLLTMISGNWELYMFVIGTDKAYYYFKGDELKSHGLYMLNFDRTGNYKASNDQWSGTYGFLNDSTQLILQPNNPYLFACNLHIENISKKQMKISSPWVQVNPEITGATDYEKFIAYQALTYLSNHQKDISKLKSVKLELRYLSK